MSILPFRQVHLDFHTSPLIRDVAADFDPDEFARTLKGAAVNSVTIFARCHHGMCYYPTQVGLTHPSLKRDLLGEMIEACHRHGIQAPIYMTVVWDEHAGTEHPEWRQVSRDGRLVGRPPLSGEWGWQWLCMNTPYADYVAALTEEVCRRYPVDGMFFDIVMTTYPGCVCTHCLRSMRKMGLDPTVDAELRQHALTVERRFMGRMTALVHSFHPTARVFYNSRLRLDPDPTAGMRGEAQHFTHWEIESLPSGGWGYNHFPLFARYYQTLGKELLGMTGRFHLSWADFGGMKNPAALEYECFRQLALGAACSIGDQLHPRGRLDPAVYDLIGSVYRQIEACQPWCVDATPQAEIGVLMPGAVDHHFASDARDILEGTMRLLTECGYQFQLLDNAAELTAYQLLIAPDAVAFGEPLASRIGEYLAHGGALLLSHRAGLRADGTAFALEEIGLDYVGPAPYAPSYFHVTAPANAITQGIAPTDYVMYEAGSRVKPRPGTELLVEEAIPYFNRTWEHFCSHQHTPVDRPSGYPLVTRHGRVIYFAVPVFHAYQVYGNRVYRELVRNAIASLLPEPLVRAGLPSAGEVTLLAQPRGPQGKRLVCHLLYYTPQRRASRIDIVEDVVPLYRVSLAVRAGFTARRVYLAPQEEDLPFRQEGAYVTCEVPEVRGHQMVVIE